MDFGNFEKPKHSVVIILNTVLWILIGITEVLCQGDSNSPCHFFIKK